jgi:hypothetical protein
MKKTTGYCILSVIPVRAEPRHASEQISQLLFGEKYELIDKAKEGRWFKLKSATDNYEGWIPHNQHFSPTAELATQLDDAEQVLLKEKATLSLGNKNPLLLSFGSRFYKTADGIITPEGQQVKLNNWAEPTDRIQALTHYASWLLNTPYLWGGRSIFGIDCSGLTQLCMACIGIGLPRDSPVQAQQGTAVSLAEANAGDLAFFTNKAGKIHHVGLLTSPTTLIHAHGKVRHDLITAAGIVQEETGILSHELNIIKRML